MLMIMPDLAMLPGTYLKDKFTKTKEKTPIIRLMAPAILAKTMFSF